MTPETRDKILGQAESLGYRPDAKLNELRWRHRSECDYLDTCIAIVLVSDGRRNYERWEEVVAHLKHAAPLLGYDIQVFELSAPLARSKRLGSVLSYRGVKGIIYIDPFGVGGDFLYELSAFRVVAAEPTDHERVSSVGFNRIDSLFSFLDRAFEMGFRRPGIFIDECSIAAKRDYTSAYFGWLERNLGISQAIPVYTATARAMSDAIRWYGMHKPDIAIGVCPGEKFVQFESYIDRLGIEYRREVKLAQLEYECGGSMKPGIVLSSAALAKAVIEMMIDRIERFESAEIVEKRQQALVGNWVNESALGHPIAALR